MHRNWARTATLSRDDERAAAGRYLLLALLGILPFLINGPINACLATEPLLYWSFELLIWVVVPAVILLIALRTPGASLAGFGFHGAILRFRGPAAVIMTSIALAPLCFFFYRVTYGIFETWFPGGGFFEYESVIPKAGPSRHLVIAYFALSAGLVEEFLFRGLLYRAAQGFKRPVTWFVVVSPLLFSLVHWESGLANLGATWAYGLLMAGAFLWLRNLWPLIAGHILTDLLWFA